MLHFIQNGGEEMDAVQENSQGFPEATAEQMQKLNSLSTTLGFQLLFLTSVLLSFFATCRQREALCCEISGEAKKAEELANVFPLRCKGTAIAIGAAGYFLWLALQGQAKLDSDASFAVRRSAELSILEAVLVLGAAVVRMTNLTTSGQTGTQSVVGIAEDQEPA